VLTSNLMQHLKTSVRLTNLRYTNW